MRVHLSNLVENGTKTALEINSEIDFRGNPVNHVQSRF
jgi:hypothetical protein